MAVRPSLLRGWRVLNPIALLAGLRCVVTILGQEFRIEETRVVDGLAEIAIIPSAESYYILKRGDSPAVIEEPADIVLGERRSGLLRDPSPLPQVRFYQVQRVPVTASEDTDGDKIDDVWELRFRHSRAALKGDDALEDHNTNGIPDLYEVLYPIASFSSASSTVLADATQALIPVTFSRPFNGTLRYLVGGTAVSGVDFAPLTGELKVSGLSANVPVTMLPTPFFEPERRLVLTLSQSATNPPPYLLGATQVHELRIIEGDQGVYFGVFSVTNGFLLGAQPVKAALRASSLLFDTSQSSFFREPFEVPVQFGVEGKPFEFAGTASGGFQSDALRRRLTWTLRFAPVVPGANNTLTAKFTLDLSGLTASGQTFTAEGLLQLNRAEN